MDFKEETKMFVELMVAAWAEIMEREMNKNRSSLIEIAEFMGIEIEEIVGKEKKFKELLITEVVVEGASPVGEELLFKFRRREKGWDISALFQQNFDPEEDIDPRIPKLGIKFLKEEFGLCVVKAKVEEIEK